MGSIIDRGLEDFSENMGKKVALQDVIQRVIWGLRGCDA